MCLPLVCERAPICTGLVCHFELEIFLRVLYNNFAIKIIYLFIHSFKCSI